MLKWKKLWIALGIIIIAFVLSGTYFYFSQAPYVLSLKKQIKYYFVGTEYAAKETEAEGLDNILQTYLYEDNQIVDKQWLDLQADNKKVYETKQKKRLLNYPDGYQIDLPADASFDFSMSPAYVTVHSSSFEAVISRERSSEDDMNYFINHYMHRFLLNEQYRAANRITLAENKTMQLNGYDMQLLSVQLNDLPKELPDGYTYVTIKIDERYFYRIMFKYHSDNRASKDHMEQALNYFRIFAPFGHTKFDTDYSLHVPENWSAETTSYYQKIRQAKQPRWGIFAPQIYDEGISKTVPSLEKKLDFQFPVVLSYIHFQVPFPAEFMQKNYEAGKLVELTFQTTRSNNEELFGYTPMLDIYRGELDEEIRKFAREAKAFGHPFLFRLNNEMNSDWTSYSGIINMSDPTIYTEIWHRFYRIFQEEGVNNAIWIFNPNDESYPPCKWNHYLAYYPGDDYVQMIGVTGYNTGNYYYEKTAEQWRTFQTIYDQIQAAYLPFFSEFPWIITEFSSSSYGGDKAQWIQDMFSRISSYPNIKIAVWFSAADYDGEIAARPYFLDETPETTAAFREGLRSYGKQSWK